MATLNIVSGPDWATIMTAFGTVGAVIAAVWIAIASSKKTDRTVAAERTEADRRLREQFDHSDEQLRKQQEHSDEQLRKQQEHSDEQLAAERAAADERLQRQFARDEQLEQRSEAASVEVTAFVIPADVNVAISTGDPVGRAAVIVTNKGRYGIENIDARLSPDGQSVVAFVNRRNVTDVTGAAGVGLDVIGSLAEVHLGTIGPGAGMLFIGDNRLVRDLRTAFPIIRWSDRWGDTWEYRQGALYQTDPQVDWLAGSGSLGPT